MNVNLSQEYPEYLQVAEVQNDSKNVMIYLTSKRETAECPMCGQASNKIHKTYLRVINDMPILVKSTRLIITIHKYCCTNELCNQKTFLESIEDFVTPRQRRTIRLNNYLKHIAMTSTGEGGARLCKENHIKISGDTLIRIAKKFDPAETKPEMIGIDDWAYKKTEIRDNDC